MARWKKIANWCAGILCVAATLFLLSFSSSKRQAQVCNELYISISNDSIFDMADSIQGFIDPDYIRSILVDNGSKIEGQRYEEINVTSLENTLNHLPAVENAEVSVALDGEVTIQIKEREPLIRIITNDGESYYIDRTGTLMPLSERYAAHVLIATGNIRDAYAKRYQQKIADIKRDSVLADRSRLDDLYDLAVYIDKDTFFKEQIEQVYITEQGEIELVPKVGDHHILFGDAQHIEKKFRKLKIFYEEGLNKVDGWNHYSIINLKYKDQVVCVKKNRETISVKKATAEEEKEKEKEKEEEEKEIKNEEAGAAKNTELSAGHKKNEKQNESAASSETADRKKLKTATDKDNKKKSNSNQGKQKGKGNSENKRKSSH